MIFLKALGRWTLANISDARFRGTLEKKEAAHRLYLQRMDFVHDAPGSVYVESNLGYYGILDVVPDVFGSYRAIYIVRDGRDWVRSMLNWGEVYGNRGIRNFLAHKWPTAKDAPGEALAKDWDRLSRFDQLCWAWARLNEFALKRLESNPHARLFHFEKIFAGEQRYACLDDLVSFATSMPGVDAARIGSTSGWLERKIHESASKFPGWEGWSEDQKKRFEELCGPLMNRLGYSLHQSQPPKGF
jgi:hypothetical protein